MLTNLTNQQIAIIGLVVTMWLLLVILIVRSTRKYYRTIETVYNRHYTIDGTENTHDYDNVIQSEPCIVCNPPVIDVIYLDNDYLQAMTNNNKLNVGQFVAIHDNHERTLYFNSGGKYIGDNFDQQVLLNAFHSLSEDISDFDTIEEDFDIIEELEDDDFDTIDYEIDDDNSYRLIG